MTTINHNRVIQKFMVIFSGMLPQVLPINLTRALKLTIGYRYCISLLLLLMVLLGGCASVDRAQQDLPPADQRSEPASEARPGLEAIERRREDASGSKASAVDALIADVARHLQSREIEKAAAAAERAIRISPINARAYFALAQVRYYQAQYGLSRSLLYKARSLARNTAMLKAIESYLARPEYQ